MANSKGKVFLPPPTIDSMNITTADTTALDLNLDVALSKWFGIKFSPMECGVTCGRIDLETLVLIVLRNSHGSYMY
jgi:hypothetical protein